MGKYSFMRQMIIFLVVCAGTLLFMNVRDGSAGKTQKIAIFPPQITAKYIDSKKGQKKVVLIYTSWCPYCRLAMPAFMKMEKINPGSVIAISVDTNNAKFSKYIQSYDKIPFKVILNKGAEDGLQKVMMEKYGAQEWKGYPTMILLDENNKVVRQGYLQIEEVAQYIFLTPEQIAAEQAKKQGAQ